MPLPPPLMSSQMVAKGTLLRLTGSKYSSLVGQISKAASSYILASSIVISTNKVVGPGAGTYVGRLSGVNANAMSQKMKQKATLKQLTGKDIGKLFDAISFGVVNTLKVAVSQGSVVGGGPGSGSGRIQGLIPSALQPIITNLLRGTLINGEKLDSLSNAIATGICNHITQSARINTTCIGAAAGPPAGPVTVPAAPGPGRLV